MGELTYTSKEVSEGGFKAVKKVEGTLYSMERVDPPPNSTGFGGKAPNDQAKVVLTDAVILEMEPGEEAPELKDDTFTFYFGFAPKNKMYPHPNTFYVKGWIKSFEDAGTSPDAMMGQRIVVEKKEVVLFKRPKADNPDEVVETTGKGYVFVPDDAGNASGIDDYVKNLITGLNAQAAIRIMLKDDRAKNSDYKELAKTPEKLAAALGLDINEKGEYVEAAA